MTSLHDAYQLGKTAMVEKAKPAWTSKLISRLNSCLYPRSSRRCASSSFSRALVVDSTPTTCSIFSIYKNALLCKQQTQKEEAVSSPNLGDILLFDGGNHPYYTEIWFFTLKIDLRKSMFLLYGCWYECIYRKEHSSMVRMVCDSRNPMICSWYSLAVCESV